MWTMNLFTVVKTNSQNFKLQRIESTGFFFDKFEGFERSIKKFKKTFKNFKDSKNQLFDAAIYGIMYYRSGSEQIVQEKIIEVLGENLFNELKEIEEEINQIGHFMDISIGVSN